MLHAVGTYMGKSTMNYYNKILYLNKISAFVSLKIRMLIFLIAICCYGQNAIVAQDTLTIDFDQGEFDAGDIVSEVNFQGGTLQVVGFNPMFPGINAAMIFDSDNPTGGDFDLGTPNEQFGGPGMNLEGGPVPSNDTPMHNVLIVSEDMNSADPDDASGEEISLTLEFSTPVTLFSFDLLDLDSGEVEVILSDSAGNELLIIHIPETGCNGVAHVVLNTAGVSKIFLGLNGSGALDNLKFLLGQSGPANTNPVAEDDLYQTGVDQELIVDAPGVLENDTDVDGDELTIVSFDSTTSAGGSVLLNPDGSFTYTPADDFEGEDTFSYGVTDGNGGNDTATVTINVGEPFPPPPPGNNPPIAVDDEFTTDQDLEMEITEPEEGILANDSDPDGDSIAALEVNQGITEQGGKISISSDGTLVYTPRSGFTGTDSYQYTICDDQDPALCDSAVTYFEVKELPIVVYNAFSPNDDGINDTWIIQGITRYPNNKVQVFNRWGNLIYSETGYDNTSKVWKGQSNQGIVFINDDAPDGAYYYIIDLGDGSERLKGFVVLRR